MNIIILLLLLLFNLMPIIIIVVIIATIYRIYKKNATDINAIRGLFNTAKAYNYFDIKPADILKNTKEKEYKELTKSRYENELKINNVEAFKNHLWEIFKTFGNAYNDLDLITMKNYTSDELFNQYDTGIKMDIKNGIKNIIRDIRKERFIVYDASSSENKQVINVMIDASYISYSISTNGLIQSGFRDNRVRTKFEVVFQKNFKHIDYKNCPNCGAPLINHRCEYCKTYANSSEYIITSIKKIKANK